MSAAVSQESWRPIATGPVILRLPVPPSTNNLFANGAMPKGARFMTKHYSEWRTEAGLLLNTQHPRRFVGHVEVIITVAEPKQRSDIDNRTKAILDLLVECCVIPTDDNSCVRKITAAWGEVAGCVVEIIPCATIVARAAA